MLNKENLNRKFTTPCISCLPFIHIAASCENNGVRVVLIGITEEQEQKLDAGESLFIETDRDNFNVNPQLCYAYGKLDLSPNSEDIKTMIEANWFQSLFVNIRMFSNYDYKTHSVTSDIPGGRWFETCRIEEYLPYLHKCIGAPERVLIFKEYVRLGGLKSPNRKQVVNTSYSSQTKEHRNELAKARTIAKRKARVSNLKFTIKL